MSLGAGLMLSTYSYSYSYSYSYFFQSSFFGWTRHLFQSASGASKAPMAIPTAFGGSKFVDFVGDSFTTTATPGCRCAEAMDSQVGAAHCTGQGVSTSFSTSFGTALWTKLFIGYVFVLLGSYIGLI